jgi:general secretion pathway protein F
MASFRYTALNASGQQVDGVLSVATEQAALAELEARELTPVAISARRERGPMLRRTVSLRHLAGSYIQIADLLRAGVPLLRSLKLLGARRSQPRLSAVFRQLADAVAEGEDLAEAMGRRPDVFPRVHIAMVRAGERGGFLENVLARLGQFVMSQAELRGKILGNMVYPGMLMVFGAAVLGVVFGVFVPMFRTMLTKGGQAPPWITRVVFAIADALGRYGPVTFVAAVVCGFILYRLSRRPDVRRSMAIWRTRAPLFGPLVRAVATTRFCRMLGTMLGNGIPMLSAMQIAKEAAGNMLLEEAIDGATEAVRAGQPLAGPLAESGLFADDVVEMISVAESANNLDSVLLTIADTIDGRVDRLLTTAVRLIEPLLLLAVAGVVAVVAVALILPMTQLKAGL